MTSLASDVGLATSPQRRKTSRHALVPMVQRVALGLTTPILILAVWEAGVHVGVIEARLMPAPSRVALTLRDLAISGDLLRHVSATLARVFVGFALGGAAGTVLGLLSGTRRLVRATIDPTIQALRAIPSIAWVPLFILWFGIFEASKLALIAVGVFFPVYLGTMSAIRSVDRKLVEVGRMFRLSPLALIRRILLPAVLPAWVVALRTGLGLGFMFVVAAEIMGASEGLGYLLVDGQQLGKPDEILAALIAFAVVGQLSDLVLVLATRPLLAWQDVVERAR